MLVPGMNIFKVQQDIRKDYPSVLQEAINTAKKLSGRNKPGKEPKVERIFDYISSGRNHWLYKIYMTRKQKLYQFMAYYYEDTGLAAVSTTDESEYVLFFTPHFFKRYNERTYLNHVRPEDIARSFMADNTDFSIEISDAVAPDVFKISCATQKGIILGKCNTSLKVCYMNTFLAYNTRLTTNQAEFKKRLKPHLDDLLRKRDEGNNVS